MDVTRTNVLEDLGFEDAVELTAKAELVIHIQRIMRSRRLTQAALGRVVGMSQSEVSKMLRGHWDRFTIDRLMRALNALGVGVRITLYDEGPATIAVER